MNNTNECFYIHLIFSATNRNLIVVICFYRSVEREASKNIEENERECFKDAIVSSRSLNKGYVERTQLKNAVPEIIACILTTSFHIVVGLSMAYSAILIPHLETGDSGFKATTVETSWTGSLIVGFLMEAFGRIRTLQLGAIPCIIGWILIATAQNIPMILVGRLLTGLAIATSTSPSIVYITEVATPDLRGSLMSFGPTLASLGMLLSYLKGAYLPWRLVAWLATIYAVVPLFLVQFFVPESPVWLVSKGRIDDAKKSLARIYKSEEKGFGKISPAEQAFITIMKENEIKLSEQRRSKRGSLSTKLRAFLKPTGWKPMIILIIFFLFQQFSGIYITLFYAVTWFQEVKSGVNEYTASILVGLTPLGMAVCMSVSGYFTLQIKNGSESGNWVPVLGLLLYVCTSMIGMLTIPWTMTAELFGSEIRGVAQSVSYAMANVLMFAAVQSYRDLSTLLGGSHAIQWFFAGVSVGAAVFVWLLLPETHGKKLSEIEEYFYNNTIAAGADAKARRRRAKRRAEQKAQAQASVPLNPTPKNAESV
ncbi:hypothetical protein G9C98_008248 [Cotesia typhae]|uniref:Major facilitator superfamily (MFS) profile domain-containing protein n=1 Tax=Cotesia typhae TaxID=2053667 RepID=A0A8J5QQR8_9HYME|nr:hypothetical protein G9C98_008248 [Cotesia typhae]